ncbi:hypothetical protein AB0C51_14905 [Streptomyces pathocidini]|uniref:Uncharacterized protein n=1 Tax=Streptomyces pathocidini TaxID=1650571 RepID=A0ABW7UT20_9ACTN|nr:hypothetical protein [Streptomyces pathocidini]
MSGEEFEYQHKVEELEEKSATAARLFDVRRIIGGLFVVYGIIVTIAGIVASEKDIDKAENININLWTGLAMLALGLLFLLWLWLRPIPPPQPPAELRPRAGSEPPGGSSPGERPRR